MDTFSELTQEIARSVQRSGPRLTEIRRELHARPELSFEEEATTALIRSELEALGLGGRPCPTATGAVALLDGGRPGATVLIRADIDALPVQEESGVPYASTIDDCMHACGHDAHTAALLGVAAALSAHAGDLPGRYLFVFQPGEEWVAGAQSMVDGGLLTGGVLDANPPAAAIGLHVASAVPVGIVAGRPGISMAGSFGLRIRFTGGGGHGALNPRQGNVVLAAARFTDLMHTVVDGMSYEGTDYVCSPGTVSAGTAPNVVPTRAQMTGTLRWFDADRRQEAVGRLETLAAEVAGEFAVQATVEANHGSDPVRNDPAVTRVVMDATGRALPAGMTVTELSSPVAASDDMAVFLDRVPGCYLLVGAGPADGTSGPHHSPTFAIDDAALPVGATALAASAVALAAAPGATGGGPAP